MKTTIITSKKSSGHYLVSVYQNHSEVGSFETTDMQLIDDIHEINNDGWESQLCMHDTFDEVIETCLQRIGE